MNGRLACGSMVLFFVFPKICTLCKFFRKKNGIFYPAGGDISRQTRDRLIHGSIDRFAFFAHFAAFVVQTPTHNESIRPYLLLQQTVQPGRNIDQFNPADRPQSRISLRNLFLPAHARLFRYCQVWIGNAQMLTVPGELE